MSDQVYKIITDRIVAMLEAGTIPWRKPWAVSVDSEGRRCIALPKNLKSGKEYRGTNCFLLGAAPFSSPYWLTFKQCQEMGGSVVKGSKGTPVIFWKISDYAREDKDTGEIKPGKSFLLRYYTVFNVEQCEGLKLPTAPAPIEAPATPVEPIPEFQPIEACAAMVAAMPKAPEIKHRGDAAYYSPAFDFVSMPKPEAFNSPAEYYSTLFHELTHSTGHGSRVGRKFGDRFGDHGYSQEELVAEMGASFLCAIAGIESATLDNSAAYIANWLKALKNDPRMLVHAGAQAQKAADFILGHVKAPEVTEEAQEAPEMATAH